MPVQPMQAGQLRRKLVIKAPAAYANGFPSATQTTVLTTWGSVTVKPGNALIAALAGQLMAQSQYQIAIRFPPSVTISPGMLVLDGSRTYRIHQVADVDERHRTMLLFCVEQPAK